MRGRQQSHAGAGSGAIGHHPEPAAMPRPAQTQNGLATDSRSIRRMASSAPSAAAGPPDGTTQTEGVCSGEGDDGVHCQYTAEGDAEDPELGSVRELRR